MVFNQDISVEASLKARRQPITYDTIGQLQAAACMCFCFQVVKIFWWVAMENRLIPRWRHTTHPGFLSLKKLSTKKYSIPKWAYYQNHLIDDDPFEWANGQSIFTAIIRKSLGVFFSLHRRFNRVSIATRQNLTGENNNKHAAVQWNAYYRQPTCTKQKLLLKERLVAL